MHAPRRVEVVGIPSVWYQHPGGVSNRCAICYVRSTRPMLEPESTASPVILRIASPVMRGSWFEGIAALR